MFAFKTSYHLLAVACLIFGAGNTLLGQNLVRNPSFEDADHLPNYDFDFTENVDYWYNPIKTLLYYTHSHSPFLGNGNFGAPNPVIPKVIQVPRTGNAACIYYTMFYNGVWGLQNSRATLAVRLNQTISVGTKVYGEFYISYQEPEYTQFCTNNHGMFFSEDSIGDMNALNIIGNPQINETSIVTDTLNWVKVSGTFIAQTPLNYLAIGNFFSNQNTNYIFVPPSNPATIFAAFYFLDDVKVRVLNPQTPDTVRICKGNVANLIATGEENHQWAFAHSPTQIVGTDSIFSFTPDSSQTVLFYGSFDTLTTYVLVDELEIDLGPDTLICSGDNFWLSLNATTDKAVWNNTLIADSLKITKTGLYWVEASFGSCTKYDSILVEVVDVEQLTINNPGVVCLGDNLNLWVKHQPYATYVWSTGETDSLITVNEDGTYHVTISHPCGSIQDEVAVVFEKCVCHFFLPNAFSPNGDGVNDEFFPVFDCSIRNYFITITDRWGNIRFQTTNPDERWNGQDAQPGVYNVHVFYQGLNEEGQTVGDDFVQVLTVIQ